LIEKQEYPHLDILSNPTRNIEIAP